MALNLSIARYQFDFIVETEISLPEYAGSALRGVFGHALRKLGCFTKEKSCVGCTLKSQCSYIQIFEPIPQQNTVLNPATPPVPYIIHAPTWGKHHYKEGDIFSFGMTLVGEQAIKQLPLIIMAWQRALAHGIGASKGKALLQQVHAVNKQGLTPIYQANGSILPHPQQMPLPAQQTRQQVTLKLITPLRLQHNGKALPPNQIEAQTMLTAMVRRVSLLEQTHGLGHATTPAQAKNLSALAKQINITHDLQWQDWQRYSNRQQQSMKLGGCIGQVQLTGELSPFMPYIAIAENTHIGKEASFGLGQYKLL